MAPSQRDPRLGQHRLQGWNDDLDAYDRASIAVDCVVLCVAGSELRTVLHRRSTPPEEGNYALPGVFVTYPEREADAVERALKTKAHLSLSLTPERLTWSAEPNRDDRGWVVTLAYLALANADAVARDLPADSSDVIVAPVFVPPGVTAPDTYAHVPVAGVPGTHLAFDHNYLIGRAVLRLRERLHSSSAALELLYETFTMRELQAVYEAVTGERYSRATFQRLVADLALVEPTGEWEPPGVGRRRAQLYRAREQ